jgi:hypothetical protein
MHPVGCIDDLLVLLGGGGKCDCPGLGDLFCKTKSVQSLMVHPEGRLDETSWDGLGRLDTQLEELGVGDQD